MSRALALPVSWVCEFNCYDHANEFSITKKQKGKEKQNDRHGGEQISEKGSF